MKESHLESSRATGVGWGGAGRGGAGDVLLLVVAIMPVFFGADQASRFDADRRM